MKDQTSGSPRRRRQHDREFKDQLIAQTLVPGASVSAIALNGGINANLLFKWRRGHIRTSLQAPRDASATLLPVRVIEDAEPKSAPSPQPVTAVAPAAPTINRATRGAAVIEVEIAGAVLRLRGAVDETMLGGVLRALRQST